jgi:hypothetical protein
MHFLGMVGMLKLLRSLRELRSEEKNESLPPLVGALFYGLNLVTIQMFYTPLEAFSVHFAALPWLAYSLLRFLRQPSRNTLLLFTTVSLLTTPQFFVPTLLLPTAILLGAIGVFGVIREKHQWKRVLVAAGAYLAVNAFWLLPYLWNLPYNAPIIQNAKINQMSSDEVYERNRAFGDPGKVLTMQGFMLDFEDVNAEGVPIYVMDAWRGWINQPVTVAISIAFALLALLGIGTVLTSRRKLPMLYSIIGVWGIAFLFLANNAPGITELMNALRERIPLFAESYRFPFTKFGLLYAFAGTVLAMWGAQFLMGALQRVSTRGTSIAAAATIGASVLVAALPAFQGNFFYDALRVELPKDYLTLFTFMNKLDHAGRTAYLPQPSYWSWKHYAFGYVGSGFLWYGLSQPLMDRAFDPWSNVNENYYWELSYAIYKKDPALLQDVLTTYDIRYIILDGNLHSPGHDRSLFTDETKELLATLPKIHVIAQYGALSVYERQPSTTSFIRVTDAMPESTTIQYSASFTRRSIDERNGAFETVAEEMTRTNQAVFSTQDTSLLIPQAVKPCGVLKRGVATGEIIDSALRMRARDQRACVSVGDSELPHTNAYLVEVTYRHISGRPLMVSIINHTAKHVELETLLAPEAAGWRTDYFLLPPLAPDGLGYTAYFTNDAIGNSETINDIQEVAWYEFPYPRPTAAPLSPASEPPLAVYHPNPSYYRVKIPSDTGVVVLSQAYNPNWIALSDGKLLDHVLVNNWANGWKVSQREKEVIMIFWPQLLEYAGFLALILLLFLIRRMKNE